MKLYSIHAGYFKLDGGAMFSIVPKSLWQRTNPPDENNMIEMATRCLLVEEGNRLILIDNGLGDKQSEKFFSYYYRYGDATLEKSLAASGFTPDDITDVFLTHLHFDHCGASIKWNKDRSGYEPTFINATYWSNTRHWKWTQNPNPREKPSFLKENILPIQESGRLKYVDVEGKKLNEELYDLFPGFTLLFVHGHTEAMMLPHIHKNGKTLVYCADLIPTHGHVPVPYIMSYDLRPLVTMEEKDLLYRRAVQEEFILFFEHDPYHDCCTVQQTEKGVRIKETCSLKDIW